MAHAQPSAPKKDCVGDSVLLVVGKGVARGTATRGDERHRLGCSGVSGLRNSGRMGAWTDAPSVHVDVVIHGGGVAVGSVGMVLNGVLLVVVSALSSDLIQWTLCLSRA